MPKAKTKTETILLTPPEAAEVLNVKVATLIEWRARRSGPPHFRLGHRTVRYPLDELEAWLDANRSSS